ncbi:MAG: hypothetical protein CMH66_04815 [Nioella sp.]|nr:hypothetical protein [Nioella sp.]|tara:strand:+ start:550 stop:756 length:207 start_codon:yes stop_codon:yes gene_type:complete
MTETAHDRLLTRKDVSNRVGFQTTAIYEKMSKGDFPMPVKIGRAARWSERAIANWIEEQKARGQQPAA